MSRDKHIYPLRLVREHICDCVLITLSLFALPAIVLVLFRSQAIAGESLLNFQITVAISLWIITIFRKNIPYNFRALFIVLLSISVGFAGLLKFGLLAGSLPMLIVVPPLVVFLFGTRVGISVAIGILLGLIGMGFSVVNGTLAIVVDTSVYAKTYFSWMGFVVGYLLAVGTILASVIIAKNYLTSALEEALDGEMGLERQVAEKTKELKKKEKLLRDSEANLNEAQRVAKVGSWYLDTETNEVVWSQELYKMYDFDSTLPPPDYTEHQKLFTPESWDLLSTAISNAQENGVPYDLELKTVKDDGSHGWMLARGEVVIDESGKTIGLQGIAQDITDRKQAEAELKESEERYALARKGANDGLWDWNLLNDEVHYSPRWKSMLGYTENEIEDHLSAWKRLLHPDDLDNAIANANAFLSSNTDKYEFEFRMQHKDGHYINILSRAFAVEGEAGKIARIVGTHVDITERKKTEDKLRNSEEKYRTVFETSQVGMALCNLDGSLVDVNQAYLDIIGYSKEEALKLSYWDITPRAYEKNEEEQLRALSESHKYGPYEKEYIHKDGTLIPVLLNGTMVLGEDGIQRIWSMVQDISDRKQAESQLSYQASHDALTALINRHEFEHRAERLLSTVKEDKSEHALCFMDLDQFKVVNDTCGHAAGDEMLRQLSTVLQETVRHRDTLARLGGDEFGVLMEHCSLDDAHRVATSLQKAIQDYQFAWEGQSFKIGVSIGLVPITELTINLTSLLRDADAACYMAKDKGRNRVHVYHAEDSEIAQRHGEMQWVTRIQHALDENRFCLYAQSILPLDNSSDKHYEFLVRMIDDKGDTIPPGAFLPAAERYNLITKIDYWVIEKAFSLLAEHKEFQNQISFISINLSGQSLAEQDLLNFIITQLDETGIEGEKVCFEITETAAISNLSTAMKFISTLKGLGCRFALDDFGSGLSSFAYLKNLPVDYLKIDGLFVKDIVDDPIDHAMVKSINEIGQVMGMKTIAEFVENDEIKGMVREIGVNYAQGYGIEKPLSFDELLSRTNNVTSINKFKSDEF